MFYFIDFKDKYEDADIYTHLNYFSENIVLFNPNPIQSLCVVHAK